MRRNPALIDLHLFLAKTKAAQTKINSGSPPIGSDKNSIENIDTSTLQQ
ncbi:MAG: hypothetical protein AB8G11_10345 [Saprospiraceae bacterium]